MRLQALRAERVAAREEDHGRVGGRAHELVADGARVALDLRGQKALQPLALRVSPTPRVVSSSAAMQKLRIATLGFRVEIAHAAVSRRPPISLDTIVARSESYTYAAKVWDLSIVQGHFLSPRAKP